MRKDQDLVTSHVSHESISVQSRVQNQVPITAETLFRPEETKECPRSTHNPEGELLRREHPIAILIERRKQQLQRLVTNMTIKWN